MPAVLFQPFGLFQSTLPVKGATRAVFWDRGPHAVSIHAPREGSDHTLRQSLYLTPRFNPRSP